MGANDYRIKMGSKTKTYHLNILKKYIAREPEVEVVQTSNQLPSAPRRRKKDVVQRKRWT